MLYKKIKDGQAVACSHHTLMSLFALFLMIIMVGMHTFIDRFVRFTSDNGDLINAVSSWSRIAMLFCVLTTAGITVYKFIKDNQS